MVKNINCPSGSTMQCFLHPENYEFSGCFFHMEKKTW